MSTLKIRNLDHGIKEVSLNRPEMRNAFNPEMIKEITKTFKTFSSDKSIRLVHLKGEGKSFCAGADLAWMQSMVNYSLEENKKDSLELFEMFESIALCPHPVVTSVHGAAFGGALGLIAASDIVIAHEDTKFCFSEVKLGIAPAVISAFVQQKTNLGLVTPYMISGRVFDSKTAAYMGLINEVATDLDQAYVDWSLQFLEAAPGAVTETKKLLKQIQNSMSGTNWAEQKSLTTDLIAKRRISTEGQEGLKGFLNKLAPSWKKS